MKAAVSRRLEIGDIAPVLRAHPLFAAWDLVPVRVIPATHSVVTELRGRANGHFLMAKTIVRSISIEHADDVTRQEFEGLMRLRSRLGASLVGTIPEPIAVVPEHCTLVMTRLQGRSMATAMKHQANRLTAWRWPQAVRASRLVGAWLKEFHDATPGPEAPFDPNSLLIPLRRAVDTAVEGGWSREAAERVWRHAEVAATTAAGTLVAQSGSHGDFSPRNVLVDAGVIRIVDWENYREVRPVYEDACTFTTYLRMLGSSPLYSGWALRGMSRAFQAGYGRPLNDRLARLYELRGSVAVLAEFGTGPGRARLWRRRAMERRVTALADAL